MSDRIDPTNAVFTFGKVLVGAGVVVVGAFLLFLWSWNKSEYDHYDKVWTQASYLSATCTDWQTFHPADEGSAIAEAKDYVLAEHRLRQTPYADKERQPLDEVEALIRKTCAKPGTVTLRELADQAYAASPAIQGMPTKS
mgnify:FL=1